MEGINGVDVGNVYYRIYCNRGNLVRIIKMEDYERSKYTLGTFLTKLKFPTEEAAIDYLRKTYRRLPGYVVIDRILMDKLVDLENILDSEDIIFTV
jgi:hypothetical protein